MLNLQKIQNKAYVESSENTEQDIYVECSENTEQGIR
jgi:hypothetical protein